MCRHEILAPWRNQRIPRLIRIGHAQGHTADGHVFVGNRHMETNGSVEGGEGGLGASVVGGAGGGHDALHDMPRSSQLP